MDAARKKLLLDSFKGAMKKTQNSPSRVSPQKYPTRVPERAPIIEERSKPREGGSL